MATSTAGGSLITLFLLGPVAALTPFVEYPHGLGSFTLLLAAMAGEAGLRLSLAVPLVVAHVTLLIHDFNMSLVVKGDRSLSLLALVNGNSSRCCGKGYSGHNHKGQSHQSVTPSLHHIPPPSSDYARKCFYSLLLPQSIYTIYRLMPWKSFEEAPKDGYFLVLVHSRTLPLSVKIKEFIEQNVKKKEKILIDWHMERDLALRYTSIPPRLLVADKQWRMKALDDIPTDNISEVEPEVAFTDSIPPSYKCLTETVLREFAKNLLFLYDPYTGGFGSCPKLTNPRALEGAIALWVLDRDIRFRMIVEDTLNVILHSPMNKDGKISTFSFQSNWMEPSEEYTVENQSLMASVLLMAAKSIPKPAFNKEALKVLSKTEELQICAEFERYLYARALALCYQSTLEPSFLEKAERLIEKAPEDTYIGSHLAFAEALFELYTATGKKKFLKALDSTLEHIVTAYYTGNAFRDSTRNIPERYGVEENARACEILLKIAYIKERDDYKELATSTLENMAKKALDEGIPGLCFITPVVLALYGPMVIHLKGHDFELKRAAFTLMNPIRIIKHEEAKDYSANLCFSNICFPETRDANQLRDYIVSLLLTSRR